jgi:hypothetical protein
VEQGGAEFVCAAAASLYSEAAGFGADDEDGPVIAVGIRASGFGGLILQELRSVRFP